MKLLTHIQQKYGISRRVITEAIKEWTVFVDGERVEGYATILSYGQKLTWRIRDKRIEDTISATKVATDVIIFHKPIGYVCSKSDPHNKTIYRLIGDQYKNYYYIGRLDKESRGMVMLSNDPAVVHKYEHPRQKVTKEYIVTVHVKGDFIQRLLDGTKDAKLAGTRSFSAPTSKGTLDKNLQYLFVRGLLVDEDGKLAKKDNKQCDLLKVVSIEPIDTLTKELRWLGIDDLTPRNNVHTYRIILDSGKKRHIRRLFSAVWGEVLDLIRTRIGEYTLDGLLQEEMKKVEYLAKNVEKK
jgi:23S rRNA pseudouridine2605 synthase